MVLSVSAINFALKSEQEQNSLIFQYQSFLNSLHFPIQIVMQSKRLDLAPYLKKIKEAADKEQNDLIKMLATDYIDFVGQLVNVANIMKKAFYVAVPYQPLNLGKKGIIEKLFKKEDADVHAQVSEVEYNRYKDELMERANIVASGLGSMGLHCVQLNTEEIIELFYKINNPEIYSKERLTNAEDVITPFVASTTEKAEVEAKADENQGPEKIIDNSSIVKEQQKQEFKAKQRAADKEADKGGTKPQSSEAEAQPVQPNQAPPQPPVQTAMPTPDATAQPQSPPPPPENIQNSNFGN